MPIDYSTYPENWLSEIRPRILKRAGNCCEWPGCGLRNKSIAYAPKRFGRVLGWFKTMEEAKQYRVSIESKLNKKTGKLEPVPNPKPVKVVLTIAHLDHDHDNENVKDERLMAMCQLHHLRYDAKMKYQKALRK